MKKIISVILHFIIINLIITFNSSAQNINQYSSKTIKLDVYGNIISPNTLYSKLILCDYKDNRTNYKGKYYILKGIQKNHLIVIVNVEFNFSIFIKQKSTSIDGNDIYDAVNESGYPYKVGITKEGYLSIMNVTSGEIYLFFY